MSNFDFILNVVVRLLFGALFCWFVLRVIVKEYRERVNGLRRMRRYLLGALLSFLAFSMASTATVFFYRYGDPEITQVTLYFNTAAFIFGVASWIMICNERKE